MSGAVKLLSHTLYEVDSRSRSEGESGVVFLSLTTSVVVEEVGGEVREADVGFATSDLGDAISDISHLIICSKEVDIFWVLVA